MPDPFFQPLKMLCSINTVVVVISLATVSHGFFFVRNGNENGIFNIGSNNGGSNGNKNFGSDNGNLNGVSNTGSFNGNFNGNSKCKYIFTH